MRTNEYQEHSENLLFDIAQTLTTEKKPHTPLNMIVNETTAIPEIDFISNQRIGLFVTFIPLSIVSLCSILLILGYFFTHWNSMMRKSLHYHVVFLLTLVSALYTVLDLPLQMSYLQYGEYIYRSILFCFGWAWFDFTLTTMSLLLTMTASLQRHILVFHSNWLQVQRKRILLHYVPLIFCLLYPPSFYAAFIFIYSCEIQFDYSTRQCAIPCYMANPILYNIDWFLHGFSTVVVLVFANLTLVIRVVVSTRRVRRRGAENWKRQRKLTLQLLAFTSLYVIVYVPNLIISLLITFTYSQDFFSIPSWFFDVIYFIIFICPVQVILFIFAIPELKTFLRRKLPGNTIQVHHFSSTMKTERVKNHPLTTK